MPIVDANSHEVLHVGKSFPSDLVNIYLPTFNLNLDFPPHYSRSADGSVKLSADTTAPPAITDDPLAASKRERIPPPRRAWDFLPDLMAKTEGGGFQPRTDLKPLHIVQPEGVSFKVNGHVVEWQNWKMHVGKYYPNLLKNGC
jgi:primary-amine oxidase